MSLKIFTLLRLITVWAFAAVLSGASTRVVVAQTGSFSGTVLIDPTEKPLANAEVLFTGLNRSVRSDSAGNFTFTGLPLGKHSVVVKLVGYESITIDVTLIGKPVEVDLLLKPTTAKLANIEVKAAAPFAARLVEFDERRATAPGRYLTADYFEKNDGRPVSSFLRENIPGLRIIQSNGRSWAASLRGGGKSCGPPNPNCFEKVPSACYMQIVVDGIARFQGVGEQEMFNLDNLNAKDIVGLEFHTTATTPLQYNGTRGSSGCGTIIIWTKGGG